MIFGPRAFVLGFWSLFLEKIGAGEGIEALLLIQLLL